MQTATTKDTKSTKPSPHKLLAVRGFKMLADDLLIGKNWLRLQWPPGYTSMGVAGFRKQSGTKRLFAADVASVWAMENHSPRHRSTQPCVPSKCEIQMAQFPTEVKAFHDAMLRIPGIVDVTTGLKDLSEFTPDTYSFPGEFGDLPHALLRRTNGGLENEAWANTEFEVSKDAAGWIAIEFIAWWVRDMSRSSEQIQLRALALPPVAGKKQLGTTLRFVIDHLVICPGGDPAAALTMIQNRAESLNEAIDEYQELLGPHVEIPKKKGWFGRTK